MGNKLAYIIGYILRPTLLVARLINKYKKVFTVIGLILASAAPIICVVEKIIYVINNMQ